MLTLIGPTEKQISLIDSESLLIIQNGSWDVYWALANEDLKVEYIEEKIYIQSPASLRHEKLFKKLLISINTYVEEKDLGLLIGSRFPIMLQDKKRVEPDLVFLSKQAIKTGKLTETIFEGEPTWIIEIVSPAYRDHDTVTKRKQYALLGVLEYWIVDPEYQTIEKIIFKTKKEHLSESISTGVISPSIESFDNFRLNIEELFS